MRYPIFKICGAKTVLNYPKRKYICTYEWS